MLKNWTLHNIVTLDSDSSHICSCLELKGNLFSLCVLMSDQGCCSWPLMWAETFQCFEFLRLLPPATQPLWFWSPFRMELICKVTFGFRFPLAFHSLLFIISFVEGSLWPPSMTLWSSLPSKPTYSAFLARAIVSELSRAVPSLPHLPGLTCTALCFLPCPLEQQHC